MMGPFECRLRRSGEDGYVMIVTLVTILIMAIGLATAAQLVEGAQRRLGAISQADEFRIEALSARNHAIFSLLQANASSGNSLEGTTIDTVTGVDPRQFIESEIETFAETKVWKDYLFGARLRIGEMPLEIYDRSAMVNVNSRSDPFLAFIARTLGVAEPNAAIAALRDFTDADDFVSIGGAEQSKYDDSAVLVPNRPLAAAMELCDVKHWETLSICEDPLAMARLFTTSDDDYLKFRTASQDLRAFLIGERNMTPVSMQMIRWFQLAETKGFFELSFLGGAAGPEYRLVIGPAKDTGRFQVVDFMTVPGEAAKPFEIQSVSEALGPVGASSSADTDAENKE